MGSKSSRNSEPNPLPSVPSEARFTVRRIDPMREGRNDASDPRPSPRSPAPAWRSPAAPPQQQRLSQRQAWMRRSHLGSLALAAPIAPAAPAATSGDGGRRRHPGARALVLDARLGSARRRRRQRRRRQRQVRAERGAFCGGGAGTAVRAAPARARSATPRLGTRAGSTGRGQSPSRPSIHSWPGVCSQGRPPS